MSQVHKVQDAQGIVIQVDGDVKMHVYSRVAPTASVAGYGIGCIWVNVAGTVGAILYVNVGTLASATWMAIA